MAQEQNMIMVEMGGTRKSILESSLPDVQNMAQEMYNLAIKAGYSEEMAKELFTLRIVKNVE